MIAPGEPAPDFELPDQAGEPVRLSSLRGRPVVLYFYPADFTIGCTMETRGFAKRWDEFADRDAVILGVSAQDTESHRGFAADCGIPTGAAGRFRLLSDRRREVMRAYGVLGPHGLARRVTFVIGPDGLVRDVYGSEILFTRHVSRALAALLE